MLSSIADKSEGEAVASPFADAGHHPRESQARPLDCESTVANFGLVRKTSQVPLRSSWSLIPPVGSTRAIDDEINEQIQKAIAMQDSSMKLLLLSVLVLRSTQRASAARRLVGREIISSDEVTPHFQRLAV